MTRTAKISRPSLCAGFGFEVPATLEQVVPVLRAFGYEGVEIGDMFDHASLGRYPDLATRRRLVSWLESEGLAYVCSAPVPNGDFGRLPWVTGDESVLREHMRYTEDYIQFTADCGVPRVRVDAGSGPLPYGFSYDHAWDRVASAFRRFAEVGASAGVEVLWEPEAMQPFNKPSEITALLDAVDHPNLRLLYDTAHFHACAELALNQVDPIETLPGGQLELIARVRGRIGHVHICDTGPQSFGRSASKVGIGQGVIDFDRLIPVVADAYDGEWWSAESIPLSSAAWADAWDDLHALNRLLDDHVRHRTAG